MKKAKLTFEGKAIELDVIIGSENEIGIDISRLKTESGFITLDPGFKNTGSCESKVTFLDGDNGILRYRGYSIEDLANNADFLEVSYLLIYGELPTKKQYKKLLVDIQERSVLDEDVKKILETFPRSAHPMGMLSSLTSSLVAFDPSSVDVNNEEEMYDAFLNLLAKIPILVAWVFRRRRGLPLEYGDFSQGYVENITKMMFKMPNKKYVENKVVVNAINKQSKKIWHLSNVFTIPEQEKLAKRITQKTFADFVGFQNSGAEATELAIKIARKYFHDQGKLKKK